MELPFQLPRDREFDVGGFGTNAVDYLIRVSEYPEFGRKSKLDSYTLAPGGEVASTMVGLQRLGLKTAYAGSFGNDDAGRIGIASLESAGVDVSNIRVLPEAETQVAFIFVDEKTGERTILWRRDPRLAYAADEAPVEVADRGRILHLTPHDTQACIEMARAARKKGTIVSLDIDNVFDGTEELLTLVDICLASEDLPGKLTGMSDARRAIAEIHGRFDCAIVGTTLGSRGSLVLCGGEYVETPAFEVPGGCVDTTGAGDAFRTGFLFGVLNGAALGDCCRSANAAAALKCRAAGARGGLPTSNELQTMLKKA